MQLQRVAVFGVWRSVVSLTGVTLLEDKFANGCWDLVGIKKLLKTRSSTRQSNEALRDGSS